MACKQTQCPINALTGKVGTGIKMSGNPTYQASGITSEWPVIRSQTAAGTNVASHLGWTSGASEDCFNTDSCRAESFERGSKLSR
jgi:hypothetical protein